MQPTNDNSFKELKSVAAAVCVVVLAFHYYYFCYQALADMGWTAPIIDRIARGMAHSGLFRHPAISKLIVLAGLAATTLGAAAPIQVKSRRRLIITLSTGLLLYFGSDPIISGNGLSIFTQATPATLAGAYLIATLTGLILLYTSLKATASLLTWSGKSQIFNAYNESFPQEERLLKSPDIISLPARYAYRNQVRDSYINLQIFRSTLIMGTPGAGKTRYVFRPLIKESLKNGMALFVYDLKYPDLTLLTYNTLEQIKKARSGQPQTPGAAPLPTFYSVNFDDFSRSHRLNAIPPESLEDISDAAETARTILYSINKKWVHQGGDFFIESAVSFFTANIWFLRHYENGRYCTLPHLIELIQVDYHKLFSILQSYADIHTLIGSFTTAYANNTMEQLQGQIDSARIPLSALASPNLYYLLSGNDFTLDINRADAPKVVCIGSNTQKQHVYGAIISLYTSRMLKLVNRKGGVPCHLFFDEFSSLYAELDITIGQARSNRVAVTFGFQDLSQVRKIYGRDHADALFNLPGNIVCGQVSGDSARLVSERFGKILQEKSTISTNSRDSSTSQSLQLDLALPASKISTLSSGEFVGITADSPSHPILLKGFHNRITADHDAIAQEEAAFQPIPEVRTVTPELVQFTFRQIKEDVRQLVENRLAFMVNIPSLARLIVKKSEGHNRRRQSPS